MVRVALRFLKIVSHSTKGVVVSKLINPMYSQVSNKRISLIGEYHRYFPIKVKEYHVINEYVRKTYDIHKWIWPNKQILRKALWYS